MITVALTGGVGAGKSTVAELLIRLQIPVVDTDVIARDLVQPGRPELTAIVNVFGPGCLHPDGTLDRAVLARQVFGDAAARRRLEQILHPRIREVWQARRDQWQRAGDRLGVVVIPLVFEIGAAGEFDRTVCIACTRSTQRRRLLERGWDDDQIGGRLAAQWPMAAKMERAEVVLWNEGSRSVLEAQVRRVFALPGLMG